MRQNAREWVKDNFSSESFDQKFIEMIKRVY
jgi:hypothetical protein